MKNEEILEFTIINDRSQSNLEARQKAMRARRDAARQERITKAMDACRIPVVLTFATWIAVAMGLAEFTLGWLATAPCLLYVCFQAGTVR